MHAESWDHPRMTHAQFEARVKEIEAQERAQPEGWWWLSFAADDGFRGVCIVRAAGVLDATKQTLRRGINPGGEIRATRLRDAVVIHGSWTYRLLTREQVLAADNPVRIAAPL